MAKARRSSPMTFAEFVATGRDVPDISRIRKFRDEYAPGPARIYVDALVIERGPEGSPAWVLTIGNLQWGGDALEPLERELYAFALDEGHCD